MKKLIATTLIAGAIALVLPGCKSVKVERNAQTVATVEVADGQKQVIMGKDGNPIILDGGWSGSYFQHWNWQQFDALSVKAGTAEMSINNYKSGADTNLTHLVSASVSGLTELAVAVGDAYVKIAGGGAQANTALSTAAKVVEYFKAKGGDATKATVTTDETAKTVKVTDGTTCISCDANGNCSSCSDK